MFLSLLNSCYRLGRFDITDNSTHSKITVTRSIFDDEMPDTLRRNYIWSMDS
jgi:hypothetical protein